LPWRIRCRSAQLLVRTIACAGTPDPRRLRVLVRGQTLFSGAGRGSNAERVEASGPLPLQAYAVRTASSALRLQRRDTARQQCSAAVDSSDSPWLSFAADGSHDSVPTPLIRATSSAGAGSAAVVRCWAKATQRCGRRAGPVDLGSGRPHRLRRLAPGASDPLSGGGVGP
jgi:hypothetical protein